MRRFLLAAAIVCLSFQSIGEAIGQHHSCGCHDCVQKGKGATPEDAPRPESGAFVGPPRTGTQVGESNSIGIEGLSLKLPELNLKLPTLNLPHFTHRRNGPKMEMDAAQAPYVPEVDRAEYSVQSEAAQRQEPEATTREEDAVQAPKFDRPLQRPEQKSSYYQQPDEATESSQAVLEQIRRFEERERDLTAQLAQMQQLMQRFTESAAAQGTDDLSDRHSGNVLNSSRRLQPQPLPAISMTRPASFEAPLEAIDRAPAADTAFETSQNRQLEAQVIELRRLVLALHQQRESLQQPACHGSSNGFQMSRIAPPETSSHVSVSPIRASQPHRLPPVVR